MAPPNPPLQRGILPSVIEDIQSLRAVVLNGPRQSGKTTLLRELHKKYNSSAFLDLDDSATRESIITDPHGLIEQAGRPTIIDEVQRGGSDLVLAIKKAVDADQSRGQFVLAGSTRFFTEPSLSESLAGRVAVVDVWPFSQGEIRSTAERFVDAAFNDPEAVRRSQPEELSRPEYIELIATGGFPEAHSLTQRSRHRWFTGYVDAITSRDLREMARVREPSRARTILECLAALTAQELNTASLSNRASVARSTVDRYVELFDALFMIHRLPPLHNNALTRASKHRKVFIIDTGLAAYLLGETPQSLSQPVAPQLGALCETFMVNEVAKQATWAQESVHLHHYRQYSGPEVDLVLMRADNSVVGLESKASTAVNRDDFAGLHNLAQRLGSKFRHGYVTYLGDQVRPFGPSMTAIPLSALWAQI